MVLRLERLPLCPCMIKLILIMPIEHDNQSFVTICLSKCSPSTRKRTVAPLGLASDVVSNTGCCSGCGSLSVPCATNEVSEKVQSRLSSASRRSSLTAWIVTRQPRQANARQAPAELHPASILSGGKEDLSHALSLKHFKQKYEVVLREDNAKNNRIEDWLWRRK